MNRLKELRQAKNRTQQELADAVGVTKRTYIYWEKGERQIKPEKAQQLADYFDVSLAYLLGYSDRLTESLEELAKNPNSDLDYYKTFKAYFEITTTDGQENFLKLQNQMDLEALRRYIISKKIPYLETLSSLELEKMLSNPTFVNELEYTLNNYLFSFGALDSPDNRLLIYFLLLTPDDQITVLNLVESLARKNKEIE